MISIDRMANYVRLAANGDRSAFAKLVMATEIWVMARLRGLGLSLQDAEDVAEDAYLDAWKNLENIREPGRFAHWLASIAHRMALKRCRDNDKAPLQFDPTLAEAPHEPTLAESPVSAAQVLASLSESEQQLVILRHMEGLSIDQAAAATGLTPNAAEHRLQRIRSFLRRRFPFLVRDDSNDQAAAGGE